MPTALDVANFFLSKTREDIGDSITHLKLQKLVYYAQGIYLAMKGVPLFEDHIEAWDHGPVVPTLYRNFREYGSNPIPGTDANEAEMPFDESQIEILNEVYKAYGQYSAWKLRAMTHDEPTWKNAYPNGVIDNDSMMSFFKTQIEE